MNLNNLSSLSVLGGGGVSPFSPSSIGGGPSLLVDSSVKSAYSDGAVQFTASDKAYLSISNANQIGLNPGTGDYSYSFWINLTSVSYAGLINKITSSSNLGYSLFLNSNSSIDCASSDGFSCSGTSAAGVITANTWINLTVVANRIGNLYVYKNGNTTSPIITLNISARSGSVSNTLDFNAGIFTSFYLNGSMDSVCYLNRALTLQEVAGLYNNGKGRCAAEMPTAMPTLWRDCVSWWDMDETGGVRRDSKGTNHLVETFAPIINNASTLGAEMVTNGGFDSDTGSWTANGSTLASVTGGQSGNCLEVTNLTGGYGRAEIAITTVVNQNYSVSYWHKSGTSVGRFQLGPTTGSYGYHLSAVIDDAVWTLRNVNFKALTTTTYVSLFAYSGTGITLFDSISVKPLLQSNLNGGFESLGTGETLGSELIVNGGFETLGAGGADVFGTWVEAATDGSFSNETTLKHGGSNACKVTSGPLFTSNIHEDLNVTPSTRYKLTFWTAGDGTNAGRYGVYDNIGLTYFFSAYTSTGIASSSYSLITLYFTTPVACTSLGVYFRGPAVNGGTAYFDDVSLKAVTGSNTFLNWTETTSGSSTINAEASVVNAGALACRMDVDAGGQLPYLIQSVVTVGHRYAASAYAKLGSAGTQNLRLGPLPAFAVTGTNYTLYNASFVANQVNFFVYPYSGASYSIYLDDITLTCTRIEGAAGIVSSVSIDGNLCASFNGTTQYLSSADAASIQCGNGSTNFEIGAWINPSSITALDGIISKTSAATAAGTEYSLIFADATHLGFQVGNGTATLKQVNSAVTIVVNNWYFVRAWIDSAAHTINISVNGETPVSTSISAYTIQTLATALELGRAGKSASYVLAGRIDGAYLLKRILTSDEATAVFNNGKGVKYASLPSTVSADSSLSFWNLDEFCNTAANVTRLDSGVNANHLTAVGNPPSDQGVNYYEGVVAKWFDQSGKQNHLLQVTQSSRLLYVQGAQSTKSVLRGDGLTKSLSNAADLIGTGDVSVSFVVKPIGWGGGDAGVVLSNGKFIVAVNKANTAFSVTSNGSTVVYSQPSHVGLGIPYVITITRTAAGVVNIYSNGVLASTANQASDTPAAGGATYLANIAAGTAGFDGDVDFLAIYKSILTPTQIANISRYLRTKFNIVNPTVKAITDTLTAQGTPADAALTSWITNAVASVNSTNYAALYQPASSTVIGFGLKGTGSGRINWGDGTSTNITLTTTEQKLVHNYATAQLRPVVLVGNVTFFQSDATAGYGGALSANFGGKIYLLTSLTYLYVAGNNTVSGSVAGLTSLTVLSVGGNNTVSGSVAGLTSLTVLYVAGNNTVSGSVAGLTSLTYLYVAGNNTVSDLELLAASNGKLSMFTVVGLSTLTSIQVNAVLAGFWANRDVAKTRATERTISLTGVNMSAPTGQGLTDKAALAAYKSPNGTGPMFWTVTTP